MELRAWRRRSLQLRMLLVDTAAEGLPLGRQASEVAAMTARTTALMAVHVRQGRQVGAQPQGRGQLDGRLLLLPHPLVPLVARAGRLEAPMAPTAQLKALAP